MNIFFSLMYGSEENTAMKFYPPGALSTSLKSNYIAPPPTWQTPLYTTTRSQIFSHPASSFRGPTNWYRCRFGANLMLGIQEEIDDNLDAQIPCRALFVGQNHRSVVAMESMKKRMEMFARDLVMREVQTNGHWVQFEARDEVNGFLEEFFEGRLG
ncbi:hypothetical protein NHQ30_008882 [Ciborinia camelliae]|nr:hypothetical protein NHQ30_008882 [Ciborinia camelliae]